MCLSCTMKGPSAQLCSSLKASKYDFRSLDTSKLHICHRLYTAKRVTRLLPTYKMCIAEYHSEAVRVENRRSQQCLPLCLRTERERETAKHAHAHVATYRRDPLCDTSAETRVPEERLNYQHVELSGKVSPLHRVYTGLWGVCLPTRAVVRPCGCFLVC